LYHDRESITGNDQQDGNRNGHQRSCVAFALTSEAKLFAKSFVRLCGRKTFAVQLNCHSDRSGGLSQRCLLDMTKWAARKPLSFPKSRRLVRPSEFERVKRDGRAQRGRLLVL